MITGVMTRVPPDGEGLKSFCVAKPTPKLRWTEPFRGGWRFSGGEAFAGAAWRRKTCPETGVFGIGALVSRGGWLETGMETGALIGDWASGRAASLDPPAD